ncbi:MAG: hypothetical protein ABMB14_37755 [Myxococcota bacterium]
MTMVWLVSMMGWAAPGDAAPGDAVVDDPPTGTLATGLMAREQELLDATRRTDPGYYEKLLRLRDTDRPAYLTALYKVAKLVDRAKTDPVFAERLRSIREHEDRLRTLAKGFSALSPADQRTRRAELEAVANELMDLKQAERRARLDELRARLADLEQEIDAREQDRKRIVDEYVDQLVEGRGL